MFRTRTHNMYIYIYISKTVFESTVSLLTIYTTSIGGTMQWLLLCLNRYFDGENFSIV